MKKYLTIIIIAMLFGITFFPGISRASGLSERLRGRILLQVESHGEAWYINPINQNRYYLGRPLDAFNLMRQFGLGISNRDFDAFKGKAPSRLSGRFVIKVEDLGKAYYVNPVDLKFYFLGRPTDAFNLMRSLGLGISNHNLEEIDRSSDSMQVTAEVGIENFTFMPQTITVNAGTRIEWENEDSVPHTVTSAGNFNSGTIAPNGKYALTLTNKGIYNYVCIFHPSMAGRIIVQ